MANYNWNQFEDEPNEQIEQQPSSKYNWDQFENGDRYESKIEPISAQTQAFQQIKQQFPNMPDHMINGLMSVIGTKPHPGLDLAAKGFEPIGEAARTVGIGLLPVSKALKTAVPLVKQGYQALKDQMQYKDLMKKQEGLGKDIGGQQESIAGADEAYNAAKEEANQLENAGEQKIGSYLNKGATHNVRAAKGLAHRMGNIEKYWGNSYKTLREDLKNNNFQMGELPKYEMDMKKIFEQVKGGMDPSKINAAENGEMAILRNKAPSPKDVSASDFLTKYQSFRDARYDLLQRAKTARDALERKELFEAYKQSKPMEKAISEALEEGLGEYADEFKRVNAGYSKQIYPLRGNKVMKSALKGKLSQNMLEEVAGNDESLEQVRELIKQDPELLRNIVGQRYASSPKGLHELDEKTAEFLSEMPELEKIIQETEENMAKQLKEVNKYKTQKDISLKQKMESEKEAKVLKEKIDRIAKDRASIKKWGKRAGATGFTLLAGKGFLDFIKGR